jgi:hypothetical protein
VRVHLERLVELECLAIRHGRLGSPFVYELLLDLDAPEAVAHVGLIDVKVLAHGYETNLAGFTPGVTGQNGHLAGDGETGPPPANPCLPSHNQQPGGVAESRIRSAGARPPPPTAS